MHTYNTFEFILSLGFPKQFEVDYNSYTSRMDKSSMN